MASKNNKEKTNRKTVEKPTNDGWQHSTTFDRNSNERWSVDTKDTGVRGPGTNWTEVRRPHHTDQDNKSHGNGRWGETKKK
jgi:hypothetical protein